MASPKVPRMTNKPCPSGLTLDMTDGILNCRFEADPGKDDRGNIVRNQFPFKAKDPTLSDLIATRGKHQNFIDDKQTLVTGV